MVIGTPVVLNLIPGGVTKVVHVNQVNDNIEIQFQIMNGSQPYNVTEGVSCTIRGTKGDSYGYTAEAATTVGSNVVTVTLTEQLTAVAGGCNVFELVFVGAENSMKVSTENFILAVERAALGEDTVISDSDLAYAAQVLDQLQSVGAVNAQVQQNKANIAAEVTRATAAEQTLQQNINSEASARQSADNTLQSNINVEASARATQDNVLQAEIDQLVAPSGSAPSAAEVTNARIGADGTTYDTLGNAIRGQVTDVKSQIHLNTRSIYDSNLVSALYVEFIGHYTINNLGYITANASYDCYVVDVSVIKSFELSAGSSSVAGYYSVKPSQGSIAIDNTRHFDLNGAVTVPSGCNYLAVCVATGSVVTASTGNETLGETLDGIVSEIDEIETMSIEGFTRSKETVSGTIDADTIYANTGAYVTIRGWRCLTVDCNPKKKYYISGKGVTQARFFYVLDSSDNILYMYQSSSEFEAEDYEYTTPAGASKLIVNAQGKNPVVKADSWNYEVRNIATETAEGEYTINTGDFRTTVSLTGSSNGTFTFETLTYEGSTFKAVNDDIVPVSFTGAGYVGAGHGFLYGYTVTATAHGLTTADIGQTYTDSTTGFVWVLIKILSEDTIMVVRRNVNNWWGMSRAGAAEFPASFTFGDVTVPVESYVNEQISPSVKNVSVNVVRNDEEEFAVAESYDIIDPSVGIAWLISNVGSNDNDTLCDESDSAVTVRNLYLFSDNGSCSIAQNLKTNKAVGIESYGGVQSQPFGTTDYYAVPNTEYKELTQSPGSAVTFSRDSWDDSTEPPMVYCQTNSSSGDKMFVIAILMEGRNANISDSAGSLSSSRKMYPYAINPSETVAKNTVFNGHALRIPINKASSDVPYFGYAKVGSSFYLFAMVTSETDAVIEIPQSMAGMNVSVVSSDGVTCGTTVVVDGIDIVSSGSGSILLKLTA